ncbi:MAG: S24/S26 family peptidase [Gemmatimonadaceae bacterium]
MSSRVLDLDAARYLELAREVLAAGGGLWMNGSGASMLPLIRPGDRVFAEGRVGSPAVGQIVVVDRGTRFVVHRVVAVDGGRIVTRGDASDRPDAAVTRQAVVGRVLAVEHAGRCAAVAVTGRFGVGPLLYGAANLARATLHRLWRACRRARRRRLR